MTVLSGLAMLALLAGGLLAPRPAAAQQPGAGPEYSNLGLTPDQMRRVQDLHGSLGARMRALEAQLRDQRQDLEALYGQYDLDEGRARQMNARINQTQQAILDQHLRLQVELRKILKADQFTRLRAIIAQRRDQMRDQRRNRRDRAGAPNAPAPPSQ